MHTTMTEQEQFWSGSFGTDYSKRNRNTDIVSSNTVLFSKILSRTQEVGSVMEFGANVGLNLLAIKNILPSVEFSAVEINAFAAKELKKNVKGVKVYHQSLLDFKLDYKRDLTLIKGVLIHTNPKKLPAAYDILYKVSSRYICLVEYYNPTPVAIEYREHSGQLFKRDFAGELLARHKDLQLLDYGFVYHGDKICPQDDTTWFLFEKK